MRRRDFFLAAGSAVGAVGLAAPVHADSTSATIASYVTNVTEVASRLPDAGAWVALEPAPDRVYDPESVAVLWGGRRLGYLPSSHGKIIGSLIKAGLKTTARVQEVRATPRPLVRVVISATA